MLRGVTPSFLGFIFLTPLQNGIRKTPPPNGITKAQPVMGFCLFFSDSIGVRGGVKTASCYGVSDSIGGRGLSNGIL